METAHNEKRQIQSSVETGGATAVLDRPTSPEQIHNEIASGIVTNLKVAGQGASLENVKSGQPLTVTPDMKEFGVEPSGGEISPQDVIRNIREEIEGGPKGTGVVRGLDLIRLKAGRQNKVINFFRRLKKVA